MIQKMLSVKRDKFRAVTSICNFKPCVVCGEVPTHQNPIIEHVAIVETGKRVSKPVEIVIYAHESCMKVNYPENAR